MLGLRFCARAFSSCGKREPLFIAMRGPLTIAASLVAEHRLQTRRLTICGSRAQPLPGMWDPPRPGLEPVSPALAGRFSTTAPPGKPLSRCFCLWVSSVCLTNLQDYGNYHEPWYSLSPPISSWGWRQYTEGIPVERIAETWTGALTSPQDMPYLETSCYAR